MTGKTIKIQLDDKVIEYKIEENQTLFLEVQNNNNELVISKNEKVDQLPFNSSNDDLYEQDYIPSNHKSSIYDVLNGSKDNDVEVKQTEEISLKTEEPENNKTTNSADSEETNDSSLIESVKAYQDEQDDDKEASYTDLINDMIEKLKNDESKKTNH